jgi:hypothetical protein
VHFVLGKTPRDNHLRPRMGTSEVEKQHIYVWPRVAGSDFSRYDKRSVAVRPRHTLKEWPLSMLLVLSRREAADCQWVGVN